ncbi:uncharacterized protein G2W53_015035 [Senna tora]|uniref:Uncharacterized protein n=1 Tax=Senna tora TaxID=362788 RepID=A0A834WUJ0_9FABA|nr:uncharacterized protein G2W53_015034 [Senna tora]KAF7832702.1 uncharacterized protein G2W53_015035 [Senna tora]
MATGQISRRRRLVAEDLAGENTEFIGRFSLSPSTSQTLSSAAPSKEDPWPPDRSLGAVVLLHQISRRRRLVAADLAGENAEVLRESEEKKPPPPRKRKCLVWR